MKREERETCLRGKYSEKKEEACSIRGESYVRGRMKAEALEERREENP